MLGAVMKRLAIALLAVTGLSVGLSQIASAADLPVKAPVYKAPVIVPFSWTGFYLGANLGYSWGPWSTSSSQIIFDTLSRTADPKVNGWLGGLQGGYNVQSGVWVYGLEGDIQITGEKASQSWSVAGLPLVIGDDFLPGPAGGGTATFTHEWKFPWFATVRGRLGYTPMPMLLLYVTGGLAVGEAKYDMTFSQPGAGRFYSLSDSVTKVGFAVGGGLEKAIDNHWSVKAEYLYVDLGTRSIDTIDVDGAPFHVEYRIRDHIARLGINYRF
jgi:outer membrane immunogenic protein